MNDAIPTLANAANQVGRGGVAGALVAHSKEAGGKPAVDGYQRGAKGRNAAEEGIPKIQRCLDRKLHK